MTRVATGHAGLHCRADPPTLSAGRFPDRQTGACECTGIVPILENQCSLDCVHSHQNRSTPGTIHNVPGYSPCPTRSHEGCVCAVLLAQLPDGPEYSGRSHSPCHMAAGTPEDTCEKQIAPADADPIPIGSAAVDSKCTLGFAYHVGSTY